MNDDVRFWLADALAGEDTSEHNRIHEVSQAAQYNVLGLVDEEAGGVIGYLHHEVAEGLVDRLNFATEAWKTMEAIIADAKAKGHDV